MRPWTLSMPYIGLNKLATRLQQSNNETVSVTIHRLTVLFEPAFPLKRPGSMPQLSYRWHREGNSAWNVPLSDPISTLQMTFLTVWILKRIFIGNKMNIKWNHLISILFSSLPFENACRAIIPARLIMAGGVCFPLVHIDINVYLRHLMASSLP